MKIFTWKQRGIVWLTTIIIVGMMGLVGYGIDLLVGTDSIFMIIAIFVSFPINSFFLARNIRRYGIDPSIRSSQEE